MAAATSIMAMRMAITDKWLGPMSALGPSVSSKSALRLTARLAVDGEAFDGFLFGAMQMPPGLINSMRLRKYLIVIFSNLYRQMGIHGLSRVIADHAPKAMKENVIGQYFGRKVAIDATMSIYQFLIAVRSEGSQLTNEAGETTSHLMGMFYRTIRMMENGIKPIYVFDGSPPKLKSGELAKRLDRRNQANEAADAAKEAGNTSLLDRMNRRTVKATKQHSEDCKRLLKLMGVPVIQAPGEAEAQCAALVRQGLAFAAGSEDMDTLTFGSNVLLRHLTFSEARKMPINEIHLAPVLEGLGISMDAFIDLCILLGCDYCDSIKGIGPTRAVALIKQHGSIEGIVASLDREKYPIAEAWPFEEARELFKSPAVLSGDDPQLQMLKWESPDEEGIVQLMVKENGFNEKRIRAAVEKMTKAKGTSTQGRLDSFFKVVPSEPSVKKVNTGANDLGKRGSKLPSGLKKSLVNNAAKKAKASSSG